ncbi:hypothetical protein niasHT_016407 [Heterodera trifolii]|uniref:Probable pectate lyase F n=1 Tax=Heterodera trifolii TaxID=157864 RepID=A0ABD2LJC5_9BILA
MYIFCQFLPLQQQKVSAVRRRHKRADDRGAVGCPNCSTPPFADCVAIFRVDLIFKCNSTVTGGVKDFSYKRLTASSALGSGDQSEGQKALIRAEKGAMIKNLIIGQNGADGIHCYDGCTLQNVWWEKVGEDVGTFRSSSGCTEYNFLVTGGGVKNAKDKVFQMNGGGTLTVKDFVKRKFVVDNVKVIGLKTLLCGINQNYGDVATIKNVQISGSKSKKVCAEFEGNDKQKEPPMLRSFDVGSKGDGKNCIIS